MLTLLSPDLLTQAHRSSYNNLFDPYRRDRTDSLRYNEKRISLYHLIRGLQRETSFKRNTSRIVSGHLKGIFVQAETFQSVRILYIQIYITGNFGNGIFSTKIFYIDLLLVFRKCQLSLCRNLNDIFVLFDVTFCQREL